MIEGETPTQLHIDVLGLPFSWAPQDGTMQFAGNLCVSLWTSTSLAELLGAVYRAAGPKKYGYLLQAQGRASVAADLAFISTFPTFLDGLREITRVAIGTGWGRFEVVQYDAAQQTAVLRVYNAWESLAQQAMGVQWGVHYLAGKFAGWFSHHFERNCWATPQAAVVHGDPYDEFLVAPASHTIEDELARIEREEQERQTQLEALVAQRTAELQATVDALQEAQHTLESQSDTIRAMATPVVQLWRGVLLVPLIGTVDVSRAQQVTEVILEGVAQHQADLVILDITGVPLVDTQVAQAFIQTAQAVKLLGARVMITGIQPQIAQTLVHLGVDLRGIETQGNLQAGIAASLNGGAPYRG